MRTFFLKRKKERNSQQSVLGLAHGGQFTIIHIDVLHKAGARYGGAVAVIRVVVARVELVHDQRAAAPTDVHNLAELCALDGVAGGISRIGRQDDLDASLDLVPDLFGP